MRTQEPVPIRLADYRPPSHLITHADLDVALHPTRTLVRARLAVTANGAPGPLRLDGEGLELLAMAIDGRALGPDEHARDETGLTIHAPPAAFTLETEVAINPSANTALSGLYMSSGRFCTQCEAEGFRRITYFLDRPDVLARFRVRVEGEAASCPTLLSNGDRVAHGALAGGRHFAVWEDPHPKPAYLFALVGGAFDRIDDRFVTMGGKTVDLAIFVDPGDAPRAAYAMDALKRSMRWDEEAFGREYDLSTFNIVAVRDFNFGAMENKGLNIFNSALLLADAETATDADYEAIEGVVAHEYFHNWTGNRITLRDWFQLALKEGLTVFRDQEFSADQRSRAVQRLKHVKLLRQRQFQEDAGPLAHPVRPQSYVKIDNFYTLTVYEKGCELIRVLKTLIGADAFARGMQIYFARCDGTAATVEDFLACFAQAAGRPLDDFARWYAQAGTPQVSVAAHYDAKARLYTLVLRQSTPPTPGQPHKAPVPIPITLGLLAGDGAPIALKTGPHDPGVAETTIVLAEEGQTVVFHDVAERPTPSLLRGFSAPVHLDAGLDDGDLARLAAHDTDPFGRWEALQTIARRTLLAQADTGALAAALDSALALAGRDPAYAALLLRLPDLAELIQVTPDADPDRLAAARGQVRAALAARLQGRLDAILSARDHARPFAPDAAQAGERALFNAALDLAAALGPQEGGDRAAAAFAKARTMTDQIGALEALGASGAAAFDDALARFYARWKATPLVLDKWFAVQAAAARPDALARAERLRAAPDFDLSNPNRVRALGVTLAVRNPAAFHARDGGGYRLLAELIGATDARNPALAARLATGFETWRQVGADRRAHAHAALTGLKASGLSANTQEIVTRILGETG